MKSYHTVKDESCERVILVGCQIGQLDEALFANSLDELRQLAETAGAEVLSVVTQKRPQVDSRWYIGEGKVTELAAMAAELEPDLFIFDTELSPAQVRNLEQSLNGRVIDRTQLILDIFASRAQSHEGKLQVELAQYKYLLPRLTGMGHVLSRLGGGIGTRGPGETKLESDRRHVRRRITDIERQLERIVKTRELHRQRRSKNQVKQVALVGYTNAGKSTLLNRLTTAQILEEDKLFATLDPTSRRLYLPNGKEVILTDTVGFIQRLPHELISAFRSTLEESLQADLLLHVVDAAAPQVDQRIAVVDKLLREIGAHEIPTITVYNKMDLVGADVVLPTRPPMIKISANQARDLDNLRLLIQASLWEEQLEKS
ncbi:GTPase HflX [Rubeoparvulum massiliense]|uniref:GTPase HflX n=1 Tax=Rubeoparvulum massiliense TaxID=1631346 RepID=UPI00069DDA7A